MTQPTDYPRMIAWTEDDLDGALTRLGSVYEPTDAQIAAVRARVVTEPALAAVTPMHQRSGRRRRLLVSGALALVVGAGGIGVAAASGVFDQQVSAAFASGSTYPYHIDPSTAVERVTTSTPDGGRAEYWTAKQGNARCGAALLDDPGQTFPGKPYRPQAVCNGGSEPNEGIYWASAKTGERYFMYSGRLDPEAVTATFISPTDGSTMTTRLQQGYYLVFLPYIPNPGGDYGITVTRPDGTTTTVQKPWLTPPGTPG